MVLITIPLKSGFGGSVSQTQCLSCGISVVVEVSAGTRIALVCKNPYAPWVYTTDVHCRLHEFEVVDDGKEGNSN